MFPSHMGEEARTRREFILLDAVNPSTGEPTKVQVSFERLQAIARRSLGHAKECGYIVPAILQKPSAVFEGLRLDEDEDRRGVGWRCYCGVPSKAYRTDGSERTAYPNQVFLVFVNSDNVAYNWRWEQADSDNQSLPINYTERFKLRLL